MYLWEGGTVPALPSSQKIENETHHFFDIIFLSANHCEFVLPINYDKDGEC